MRRIIYCAILINLTYISMVGANEKYAVIIGINNYQHPRIRDLHYSEPDALYLKDIMIKYARYKSENVHVLLGEEATYLNIKDQIYWLGDQADPEDEVFFYFSGHGTRVEDRDGNEEDGMDEAFCPYETNIGRPSSVILDDDIGHWFRRIRAKQILVVLDCCHSGGAAGRSLNDDGSRGLDMAGQSQARSMIDDGDDPYARDLTLDNKFIITASDANEQSYENPDLGHGVFTYYVGEAMRGSADSDDNKEVTSRELYNYTRDKTLKFARSINQTQNPMCFGSLYDAIVCEINNQLCDLKYYDPDLNLVFLGAGEGVLKPGDQLIIRKNVSNFARDIEVSDMKVFKVEVMDVNPDYSRAKIVEEYFSNVRIDPSKYSEYYGERLETGSLNVMTEPWSTVYLDGKKIGPTPLHIPQVTAGDHILEFHISEIGYPGTIQKHLTIESKKQMRIFETFERKY
ncbi:MAG: caspase family protein [bacterium]